MNNLIAIIEDLIDLIQEMIQIEQMKLESASKNRVTHLEDCMNKEQAAILKLKGLDKKREDCQEKLGYKGYTFKQILAETTGEEHDQLTNLFDMLSHYVTIFKDTSESARTIIEVNLHTINKTIQRTQSGAAKANTQWEGQL